MMQISKLILVTFTTIGVTFTTNAQVTVGSGEPPLKGALLDIKDQKADPTTNITATKGGFILPRVQLVNINTLEPFIRNATAQEKKAHVGLTVYNLNTTGFKEGLYLWNGVQWSQATTDIQVENGLQLGSDDKIELGGTLIKKTTIETDATNTLNLTGLETVTTNATQMVVDVNTGQVGISAVIPATIAFFQSPTSTNGDAFVNTLNKTGTDAGGDGKFIVPWDASDEITNLDLVTLNPDNSFTVNKNYTLEMSGYVCCQVAYKAAAAASDSRNAILLNAALEVDSNDGNGFQQYAAVRVVWANDAAFFIQTMTIPPVLLQATAGTKIRLVLQRPLSSGSFMGVPIGYGSSSPYSGIGITPPMGSKFSKGLKIQAIG